MKNKLKKSISAIMASACMVMSLPYNTCLTAPTVCTASYLEEQVKHLSTNNLVETGSRYGQVYYLFNDEQGEVSFEDSDDFNTVIYNWDSVSNSSFFTGAEYTYSVPKEDINEFLVEYKAELTFGKGDSFGFFIDLESTDAEARIVEGWGSEKPWKNGTYLGEFTSYGVTYDIYQTKKVLEDNKTVDQYWSVVKASGSFPNDTSNVQNRVNVKDHLDAWERAGLTVGKLKDIYFNVNCNDSTGKAVLKDLYLTTDFKDPYENTGRYVYPEPWSKDLKGGKVEGYSDGYDYIIDRDLYYSDNGEYSFINNDKNGFSASWKAQSDLGIYKGRNYKKPVSVENIKELSVDYDININDIDGENIEYGVACEINSGRDKIYIIDGYSSEFDTSELSDIGEYVIDGITYRLYNTWPFDQNERSYFCVPDKNSFDAAVSEGIANAIDVKAHIDAIKEADYVDFDVNGCYFYVKSDETDAELELNSLKLKSEINSSLMGLLHISPFDDEEEESEDDANAAEPEMKGDINGDNIIDAFDLIHYRRYLLSTGNRKPLPNRADINDDGKVLLSDMVLLKKYILGRSKKLGISDIFEYKEEDDKYFSSVIERSKGSIVRDKKADGNFTCAFKSVKGAELESGALTNYTIDLNERSGVFSIYDAEIEADNDYLFGIHGQFHDNNNEFYIIEAGRYKKLFGKNQEIGTFISDGYIYDVYKVPKGKPLANGKYMCYEYWSVMRNYSKSDYAKLHVSGNINILDHIAAYEEMSDSTLTGLGLEKVGLYFKCSESMLSYLNVNDNRIIED